MVEDLSLKEVSHRLAEFILNQLDELGRSEDRFELVHSNQEVADIIGTVREVVSRAFTKLQQNGWIHKVGRSIRILDRKALEEHTTG
jgi:CRP/FNR family transcriptional regulator